MSVITKDLGVATAYGYAKSKGYTGTEEEFAELMASYADVAQQAEAAAQDAEDAKDEAVTAKTDAQTAKTAAQAAQSAAETASGTASAKASEAAQSAQSAAGSASAAQTSATAASGSASTAQTAAQTATNKASEASSSASAASTAKTGAETARTGAQTAQTAAETAQANAEAAASSVSASAAQIETNKEDIVELKNDLSEFPNGNYPQMGAGYANQLVSGLKKEDQTPYNFRAVPYDATLEKVEGIVGVDVVVNQLLRARANGTFLINGVTFTASDGVITTTGTVSGGTAVLEASSISPAYIENHVYYLFGGASGGGESTYRLWANSNTAFPAGYRLFDAGLGCIKKARASENTGTAVQIQILNGVTVTDAKFVPQLCDLTQTFGTAIADYVYSLESATAGAGVAWLKTHFPKQFDSGYQAYDAGSMQSVSGLTAHKMVGFNQWDEEWEVGYISVSDGQPVDGGGHIRSKNFNRCVSNTAYYYKGNNNRYVFWYDADKNFIEYDYRNSSDTATIMSPANASYFKVRVEDDTSTYNHDICINFHWDGEKDGQYEPYKTWSYALDDSVTLRGIPKVDASGNLYYDGDEYLPDGTVNRRYSVYTFTGAETWDYISAWTNPGFRIYGGALPSALSGMKVGGLFISDLKYTNVGVKTTWDAISDVGNLVIGIVDSTVGFVVRDDSFNDASAFKASLVGKTIIFELATPTTETADPYQETQIVDDFGTEEFILADGAFPVPVGHETYYQNNLRAKLEMSPDSPDGDGLYVVQQESGENTYVPLASTATIQDILTRLTALENA